MKHECHRGLYLGVLIDSHLNFSFHINSIATKLTRSIGMLAKIRHYVTKDTLRSICFGIFSSILQYGSQIWGQIKSKHFNRLVILQNKAVKVLNFANFRDTVSPQYKTSKILKLSDSIRLQNVMYVLEDIKGILPPSLQNTFILSTTAHTYKTRSSIQHKIKIPTVKTTV